MGDIIDNITLSNAKTISVSVIREAFINMECTLQDIMMLVPAPQDLVTGEPGQSAIAAVNVEK